MGFDPSALGGLMAGFQQQMDALKSKAAQTTVEGTAGGGLVRVVATGGLEVTAIEIDDSLVNSDEKDMLEDLIRAATNDAMRKAQAVMSSSMQGMLGGMGLPPGLF
jgi:hypothetical protein